MFIDHFVSTTRGRKIKGFGIKSSSSNTSSSHKGGLIFVDAATGWINIQFQSHLNSHETISAVDSFEALARDNGIIVKGHQSDNGSAFTSKDFKAWLAANQQFSQLAPPGSHHINSKAERNIRTVMAMARTMLLHAAVHWPDQSNLSLWSLAVKHAVWIFNHIPHPSTGLSPNDLWSKTKFPLNKLTDLHVFGCPVHVLQKKPADGKSPG